MAAKIFTALVGAIVTKMAIRAGYEAHFESVLIPTFLKALPRASRKDAPTYEVLAPMPSPEDYRKLLNARFTLDAESAFESAKSSIEDLGNELRDWHNNLPEGLNSGSKADEIEEAASALEGINWPDFPECANGVTLVYLPEMDQSSRPKRCADATGLLDAVHSALDNYIGELEDKLEGSTDEAEKELISTDIENIRSFMDELENAKSEAEGVSFPSMM